MSVNIDDYTPEATEDANGTYAETSADEVQDSDGPEAAQSQEPAKSKRRSRRRSQASDAATTRIRRNAARQALRIRSELDAVGTEAVDYLKAVLHPSEDSLDELAVMAATAEGSEVQALGFAAQLRGLDTELERVIAIDAADDETVKSLWKLLADQKLVPKNQPASEIKLATTIATAVASLDGSVEDAAEILTGGR